MYILVNESDIRSKAVRERYHERMPDGRLILTPQELKMAGSLNCEIVSTARELKAMIEEQRKNPLLPDQGEARPEAHPDPPKGGSEESEEADEPDGANEPNEPNGTDEADADGSDTEGDADEGDTDDGGTEGDAAGGTEDGADADNADVDGGEEAEGVAGGSDSDDNDGGGVATAAAKQRRTR